jgi:hypothetical protein
MSSASSRWERRAVPKVRNSAVGQAGLARRVALGPPLGHETHAHPGDPVVLEAQKGEPPGKHCVVYFRKGICHSDILSTMSSKQEM